MTGSSLPMHAPAPHWTPERIRHIVAAVLTAFILFGCRGNSPAEPNDGGNPAPRPRNRVLFIGNSLTLSNNLPAIVQALAAAADTVPFSFEMIAYGGFALEDHWVREESHDAISRKQWDVVVLQQGMSGFDEGRANLIDYAGRYDTEIRAAGAVPALYAVWPPKDYPDYDNYFDRITESYRLAAAEVDGLFLPVGEAWRNVLRRDSTIALYSSDNLHPTLAGSYLAALVMFQQLYDRSPVGLPSTLQLQPPLQGTLEIPPAVAAVLQAAAAEANEEFRRE